MNKKLKLVATGIALVALVATTTGCRKPVNVPEFVDIQPNETAFLIPLEGKTSNQAAFDSEQFLQDSKVATKRIEIPHRWVKTGRYGWQGVWMDTMAVIKVDRTQETREWTAESNQGVKVRSKDGIGFTVGVSATSGIANDNDAAKFLYKTSGSKTLAQVMDSEVRNRIETKLIEQFAKYDMTYINVNKGAIMELVAKDIVTYFSEQRGLTIANLGYKGDIVFDDPKVQEALNAKFTALQEQEAKITQNQTAVDTANAQIKVKEAEAKAKIAEAQGIAEANKKIQSSLTTQVIQQEWIDKWDGKVATIQAGNSSSMMIQVPSSDNNK
jgi:regulator of protease activity HflC (stomatin/prohibitin superfamily)